MNKNVLLLLGIFSVVVLQSLPAQPETQFFASDSMIVVVPFTDQSGFSGRWNLAIDIPRFFTLYFKERFRIGVVSPISVKQFAKDQRLDTLSFNNLPVIKKIAEHYRVRYVISAEITEFSIGRFMVSEVQLAGYEAFSAEVAVKFTLYDAARLNSSRDAVVYEGESEGIVKNRGLGITLFGKQTEQMNQYFSLDEVAFGSETFNKTIIGEALLKCADDLSTKLERAIPSLVSKSIVLSSSVVIDSTSSDSVMTLTRQLINGEVVIVDGDDVFLNLGSKDGIKVGDVLPVFVSGKEISDPRTGDLLGSRDTKTGEVQVIEIRAEHLCLATIITGKGTIFPKQRVRKVLVR